MARDRNDEDDVPPGIKRFLVGCAVLGYISAAGCLAIFAYDFYKANREAWRFNEAQAEGSPDLTVVGTPEPTHDQTDDPNFVERPQG